MAPSMFRSLAALFVTASLTGAAHAQVVWDEAVDGDFSDDRFAPSSFPLAPGSNVLQGHFDGDDGMGGYDLDYYSVTIPAGAALTRIDHLTWDSTDSGAFMAIAADTIFPIAVADATPTNLMGWVIFGTTTVGVDIFFTMSNNGIGFDLPLGPGTYTFWSQQEGAATDYSLDFVVVPAPVSAAVVIGGLALAGRRRRI